MTEKRPLNIPLIREMQRQFHDEYWQTGLLSIAENYVHILPEAMVDVAPLEDWQFASDDTTPGKDIRRYLRYEYVADGLLFMALRENYLPKDQPAQEISNDQ